MSLSPFDSAIYGSLFGDGAAAAAFTDDALIAAMLRVEVALAAVQGRLGLIPQEAAARIAERAGAAAIDAASLASGTASAGLPVPAFVDALRAAVGGDAARFVHFGATSQDILDTALVLRIRPLLDGYAASLDGLVAALAGLADAHRRTPMAARTRSQQAAPMSFGLKAATWMLPLVRERRRLDALRPALLCVQLGGATGTLSAMGDAGIAVMEALAAELELNVPPLPWHTQRDAIACFGGWLSAVTGALGKIGNDVVLMAQSEVGELRLAAGGGSSTLPQKQNPVMAETLVTLARFNAGQVGTLHQALVQDHERGGIGWPLEWLVLPQMLAATGGALARAAGVFDGLYVDAERMRANLDASNGLVYAEAIAFALAAHMPLPDAQSLVKNACRATMEQGGHVIDRLEAETDAPVDWRALRDPVNLMGPADALIDRALAEAGQARRP